MQKTSKNAPGYIVVQEAIRQRILDGKLVVGQKITAERELEKEFGLSRLTINKGIAGLVAEGMLERRHGQGTFVAQVRPEATVDMPRLVKFISPLMSTGQAPLRNTFLEGMHSALSERNFDTGIDFYHDATEAVGYLQQADARHYAGFLIFYEPDDTLLKELHRLRADGFPFVLIDAFPQDDTDMDFVVSDNVTGACLAVKHLSELGHRTIAYITRSIDRSSLSDRLTGFFKGMTLCNSTLSSNSVWTLTHAGPAALAEVRQTVDTILALPEPPTALFFSNDDLALEAIDHLQARGVRIPEEMSVMGYDNIDRAETSRVSLTTVEQDFRAMG
ncbi:MAG TPA: GntR family transcriptional regulator, partial [Armatimonadota bacterium]|nr:GntR family transcriptional regulator [Armatimonadota bacterium]